MIKLFLKKAGYTAQDAPSRRLKITGDGVTDGLTDGPTDGQTDGRTDGRTDGHNLLQRCDGASKNEAEAEAVEAALF